MEVSASVHAAAAWVHAVLLSLAPASPAAFGVLFLAVFVAATMLGVPRTVLTLLAGSAFGPWAGFVLAWAAAVLASMGSYELARLAARSRRPGGRVDRVVGRAEAAVARAAGEQSAGARAERLAGMVSLRLLPVLPFWMLNYGSGALAVPRVAFVVGSAIGLAPGAVLYAVVGGGLDAPGWLPVLLAALSTTALAGLGLARWRSRSPDSQS
ncbi:TVP38/TMEM64 family protein [Intrasporangium sp. YIM S08009]|uniref:TVP38/TMEM64 family protein n=1 Tax=Intrasporangium zincisolvens TaxID=3080018 RepID=UPI002B05F176|nr:VTT domain-containing protein [Intrasporangium sp. YIM S08009]